MSSLNRNKVGIGVKCSICDQTKKPHGRSAPLAAYYCDHECPGYYEEPIPGSLWPGESEEEFGYQVGEAGTRMLTQAELDARAKEQR